MRFSGAKTYKLVVREQESYNETGRESGLDYKNGWKRRAILSASGIPPYFYRYIYRSAVARDTIGFCISRSGRNTPNTASWMMSFDRERRIDELLVGLRCWRT